MTIKETPDRDEIAAALMTADKLIPELANAWADFLNGLPWKYIHPVVQIAVNAHHQHPALVLAAAIAYSDDEEFKTVARAHLDQHQASSS